jgi:hypothetical protein
MPVNTIDFPDIPCGFPVPIHYQYNSAAISGRYQRGQGRSFGMDSEKSCRSGRFSGSS